MATEYGVGITNRYAFLVDDVEELEVLEKKDVKGPTAQPAKSVKNAAPGVKDKKPKAKTAKSTSSIETQKDTGREYSSRGRGGTRGARSGGEGFYSGNKPDNFNDPDAGGEGFEVAGGRGNRSSGRGGRGGLSRGGGRSMTDQDRGNKENFNEFGNSGGRGGERGGGSRRGGGRPPRNNSDNYESNGFAEENGYEDSRGERGNGNNAGREFFGRGRGPRGGGGGRGGGRRDYDRQSGSDKSSVKPMDKREGGGAHNWGTYKDDEFKDETDAQQFVDGGNGGESNRASSGGAIERSANEDGKETSEKPPQPLMEQELEPEPKTLTLDEWKAMQEPRATPKFNIRKPNDGEDPKKWKNLVLRKKNKLDDDEEFEDGEDIWVPQRAGRLQRITDIGFHFEDDRVNERGFRRGPKQLRSGPRDKDRQFMRVREPRPPQVDDVNDFPTL